jgi:hypothetical protein
LIVDDNKDYIWSIFLKNKMFTLLTDLKIYGMDVKSTHCDDSGENKSFYESCQENGHNIKFEFSGPRTPQRNGKVERKFQTFYWGVIAIFNNGRIVDNLRTSVWAECARATISYPILPQLRQRMSDLIS